MSMLHEISALAPRFKKSQRKGRGESSGRGKTSGRGNKGSKARTGTTFKRGHEHGQTPLYRRLPKRGFSNENFERRFHIVNLVELERFDNGATVDANVLIEAGLVPDDQQPVKILGDGAITKKLTVVAGWYSRSAHQKITEAGGTAQNLKGEAFAFPKPKKKFVKREAPKKSKAAEQGAPEGEAPKPAAEAPAAPESGAATDANA
ncbi:MAG TPA: 50S ribosomal protein L15 [Tepidisphaeraceae bacterium]|nr:50S ribosomal protein L15 [Tepidisphaeraceae bacterium]